MDWYDYGFRNYDAQIGRFPQLDPLTDEYPHYTPYQYAGNEPIANVDLDGLEELSVIGEVFQGAVNSVQQTITVVGHATKAAAKTGYSLGKAAIFVGKAAVQVGGQIIKGAAEDAIHGVTYVGTAVESGAVNVARELYYEGVHTGDAYDKEKAYTQKIYGFSFDKGFYESYDYKSGGENTDDAARGGLGFGGLAGSGEFIGALERGLVKFTVRVATKGTVKSAITILGHLENDIPANAAKYGGKYFNTLRLLYSKAANQSFLDNAIRNKETVILSISKTKVRAHSVLEWEINYLREKGYKFVDDFTLIPK